MDKFLNNIHLRKKKIIEKIEKNRKFYSSL